MAKRWFVVHAYSGFEKAVMRTLKERVALANLGDFFGEILVPAEEVVEMRGGQKRRSERKFFPGYVLVEMELNEETWHLVKNTPRVMGFIGGTADRPAPLSEPAQPRVQHQCIAAGLLHQQAIVIVEQPRQPHLDLGQRDLRGCLLGLEIPDVGERTRPGRAAYIRRPCGGSCLGLACAPAVLGRARIRTVYPGHATRPPAPTGAG